MSTCGSQGDRLSRTISNNVAFCVLDSDAVVPLTYQLGRPTLGMSLSIAASAKVAETHDLVAPDPRYGADRNGITSGIEARLDHVYNL